MAGFFRRALTRSAALTLAVVGGAGCDFTGDVSLGNDGTGGSSATGGTGTTGGSSNGGSGPATGGVAGDVGAGAPSGGSGNASAGGSGNATGNGGTGNASGDGGTGNATGNGGTGNASGNGGTGNASGNGGTGNASGNGGTGNTSGNGGTGNLGGGGRAGAGGSGAGGAGNGGAGRGGNGGAGGGGGSGNAGGQGTAYLGCNYVGGVNRIVVSKRDRTTDRCVGLVFWSPMSNGNEDLALPESWALDSVVVGPADECPSRLATRVSASVSGSLTFLDGPTPSAAAAAHVAANVTIVFDGSEETLRVDSVDVRPMCNNVCGTGPGYLCNDNPLVSSIHGRCTPAGNCVCDPFEMNPETGRCY